MHEVDKHGSIIFYCDKCTTKIERFHPCQLNVPIKETKRVVWTYDLCDECATKLEKIIKGE